MLIVRMRELEKKKYSELEEEMFTPEGCTSQLLCIPSTYDFIEGNLTVNIFCIIHFILKHFFFKDFGAQPEIGIRF